MPVEIFLEGRLGTYRKGRAEGRKVYRGKLPSSDGEKPKKVKVRIPFDNKEALIVTTKGKSQFYSGKEINAENLRLQPSPKFLRRVKIFGWRA